MRSKGMAVLLLTATLSGCGTLAYYGQAMQGQWEILVKREKASLVMDNPDTLPELRWRLQTAAQLRQFAVDELGLPDTGSYRDYADLGRPYSVWVVFAAPADSLVPHTWCYPVVGCLSYRGFFRYSDALLLAQSLQDEGLDTHVQGVAAYSTLGWFDDPLQNTFIHWRLPSLAHLLFHEMAHQRLYVQDDTAFNESYAEAVAILGVRRWLAQQACPREKAAYEASRQARAAFLAWVAESRQQLTALYRQHPTRAQKAALLAQRQQLWAAQKHRLDPEGRHDFWFADGINNAKLASVVTYSQWVETFLRMFHPHEDLATFHQQAARLADLPFAERQERLRALMP